MDDDAALTYSSYLALDEVLGAQRPRRPTLSTPVFPVLWAIRSRL